MVKYLKTRANTDLISGLLKRYLQINKYYIILPKKLTDYLESEYGVNIRTIINELISSLRVSVVKDDLVQIFILNKKVGKTTLEALLQLVEYGNTNIEPTKCISKLLNKSLLQVKNYLGGV